MHVTFSFAFSSRYAKTQTSNFHMVVWQHTERMMGIIILIFFWKFSSLSRSGKVLKNPLRMKKVIAMSLQYYFFFGGGAVYTTFYETHCSAVPCFLC